MDRITHLEEAARMIDHVLEVGADLSGSEISALLREKRITLAEIASLEGVKEGSTVDELTRRRQDRRAAAGVAQAAE